MNPDQTVFTSISRQIQQVGLDNSLWQLLLSAAIILIGFILLDMVFRRGCKLLRDYFDNRPLPAGRRPPAVLMPLRLAAVAALLLLAETPLKLPKGLLSALHGFEAALLFIAALIFAFQLTRLLKSLTQGIQDSEPNTRLRLILQAAVWPINLLLIAGAIFCAKSLLKPTGLILRSAPCSPGWASAASP